MKFIKIIPISIGSLALSLAALGNLLLPSFGETARFICGITSAIIILLFALKLIFDSSNVKEELKSPVPLSVLPNATMTLMLLATYIHPYLAVPAIFSWYFAALAHIGIMLIFFRRFVVNLKIANVFPSWFVAFVGITTVSITAPIIGAEQIGQAVFYIAFVLYFIALPLVLYRMIKSGKPIPEPLKPTIVIFTAPMSLLVVGYLSSFGEWQENLLYFMLIMAFASYLYVTFMMITSLLKIKFCPTYTAFTFPFVISAIAFERGAEFLSERGAFFMSPIAHISKWMAVAIVLYVIVRYVIFFWQSIMTTDTSSLY